jgi:hypothetical protein
MPIGMSVKKRFDDLKRRPFARNETLIEQCGLPRRAAMEPAASCSMASNRAIMPRADSTSSTIGRSDEGLPSPHKLPDDVEGRADTRQGHGAAASTARFCCSSRDALVLCIKCGHLPRTSSASLIMAALTAGWHAQRGTPSQDAG